MEKLRVAFARGVTPGKWARIWAERFPGVLLELSRTDPEQQLAVLHDGGAELSFVRLPIDPAGIHLIPLYEERPVVVVSRDHLLEAADAVTLAELDDEVRHPFDADIETTLQLVAAGVGVVVVPQSIARLHARKDLVARPVTDAPGWQVGLAWLREPLPGTPAAEAERIAGLVDDFIGVVRGRTANSSRAASTPVSPGPEKGRTPPQRRGTATPAKRPGRTPRSGRQGRRPTR